VRACVYTSGERDVPKHPSPSNFPGLTPGDLDLNQRSIELEEEDGPFGEQVVFVARGLDEEHATGTCRWPKGGKYSREKA